MARVPTAPLPTERNAPVPVVYRSSEGVTPDAFGAAEARATERLGQQISQQADVLADRALRMQQEDNIAEAKRLDIEFSTALRERQQTFMETRQGDTVRGYDKALEDIEELRRSALGGVSNPRVLEMATNQFHSRTEAAFNSMAVHVATQRNAHADAMGDALIDLSVSAALANLGDEDVLAAAHQTIIDEFAERGVRRGWLPEQVESGVLAATTNLHSKMIDALLENDPGAAAQYFADHKDEIDGAHHRDLQEKLRVIVERTVAQEIADDIMTRGWTQEDALIWIRENFENTLEDTLVQRVNILFGEEMDTTAQAAVAEYMAKGMSEEEARDRAQADYSGKLEKAVTSLVQTEYATRERFENEERAELHKLAGEHMVNGGYLANMNPEQYHALTPSMLTAYQQMELNRGRAGQPWALDTSNEDVLSELWETFIHDPAKFRSMDISILASALVKGDWDEWKRRQAIAVAAFNDSTTDPDEINASYTRGEAIALRLLMTFDNFDKDKDQTTINQAYRIVSQVTEEYAKKGERPPDKAFHDALLFLTLEGMREDWVLDSPITFSEVFGEKRAGDFYMRPDQALEQADVIAASTGFTRNAVARMVAAIGGNEFATLTFENIKVFHGRVMRLDVRGLAPPHNTSAAVATFLGLPDDHVDTIMDTLLRNGVVPTMQTIQYVYETQN